MIPVNQTDDEPSRLPSHARESRRRKGKYMQPSQATPLPSGLYWGRLTPPWSSVWRSRQHLAVAESQTESTCIMSCKGLWIVKGLALYPTPLPEGGVKASYARRFLGETRQDGGQDHRMVQSHCRQLDPCSRARSGERCCRNPSCKSTIWSPLSPAHTARCIRTFDPMCATNIHRRFNEDEVLKYW